MSDADLHPAGWYDDPFGDAPLRWWNGAQWTPATADSTTAPAPTDLSPRADVVLAPLPFRAAGWALLAILTSAVVAFAVAVLTRALGAPDAVIIAASQLALWAPLVFACWYTSQRLGTGDIRVDFGIAFQLRDVLRGLGVWFVGLTSVGLVLQFLPEERGGAGNTELAQHFRHDAPGIVVVLCIGIIGAPIIEELFFRGLLLRSLVDRVPTSLSVLMQALVFGALHASPIRGINNLNVVAATATLGVVFGFSAVHYRRLGPGILAHAIQNTIALSFALFVL